MENIIKFVPEQLLILVVALYVIGMFLKKTPRIADWSIHLDSINFRNRI